MVVIGMGRASQTRGFARVACQITVRSTWYQASSLAGLDIGMDGLQTIHRFDSGSKFTILPRLITDGADTR